MTHVTITVHNAHANADETYSGVPLAALLAKLDAPLGAFARQGAGELHRRVGLGWIPWCCLSRKPIPVFMAAKYWWQTLATASPSGNPGHFN